MLEVTRLTISVPLTKEEREALDRYLFESGMNKGGLFRQLLLARLQEAGIYPPKEDK